jgi:hypothetical protein
VQVKVLPRDFALVRTTATLDRESQYPAAFFVSGQGGWVHCTVVGFERDRASKQSNVVFEIRVLDESGKPTLPKPMTNTVNKDVPADQLGLATAFPLSLNRPGDFTVELSATDKVSGKKAQTSFPLIVLQARRPALPSPIQQSPSSSCSPVPTGLCPPVCWSMPGRPIRWGCRPWRR